MTTRDINIELEIGVAPHKTPLEACDILLLSASLRSMGGLRNTKHLSSGSRSPHAVSISAQAQLSHTYVSSKGDDASNCSLTTPCRYLQAALTATGAGGEITILDTADINNGTTLTINKAISIANAGSADAQITFPPGYGVAILIERDG